MTDAEENEGRAGGSDKDNKNDPAATNTELEEQWQ